MYIINTTFVTHRRMLESFIQWLKGVYVPAALTTGLFSNHRVAQILHNEDPETVNIACEFSCDSLSECVRWHDETALMLREDMAMRYGDNVLFFTTYMKTIDE